MKKLKIGTVAHLTGFSPSGIRFYENRGFIHPTHEGNGQYRSFDFNDVARLLDCKSYRECGCTSAEIVSVLQASPNATADNASAAMEACSKRIHDEIRHRENLEALISERLASLNAIAADKRTVALVESPAFYWARLWIPQGEEDVDPVIPSEEEGFRIPFADSSLVLEENWAEHFSKKMEDSERETNLPTLYRPHIGYGIERKYTDEPPRGQHVEFLPSRRCLHTIVNVNTDFSVCQEQLDGIYQSLYERNLAANGRPFTHRIITFYQGAEERRFDDLWVPVREEY